MSYIPSMVDSGDNGQEVYLSKTDHPLVEHWARRYNAETKVKWVSKTGAEQLADSDDDIFEWERGETVWAASSLIGGAYRDADLIKRLSSTKSLEEYNSIRRNLSEFGYPEDALNASPPPK